MESVLGDGSLVTELAGILVVLLSIAGYVLGTYAGLLCMWMLEAVAAAWPGHGAPARRRSPEGWFTS